MEYRGIQLDESVKLYKKNGEFNQRVKRSLDTLVDLLKKNNHILKSEYKGGHEKALIDFKCGHEPNLVTLSSYKCNGVGCPECAGNTPEQGKKRLIETVQANHHVLMSDYKSSKEPVLIDFKCGHEPHSLVPYAYFDGVRCPKCSSNPEQAKNDFFEKIKENDHEILTEYVNVTEKILINFKCGHEPEFKRPTDYKKGKGCLQCAIEKNAEKKLNKSEKAFRELAKKRNHVIVEYKGLKTNALIDFKCGHEPQRIHANVYFYRNGGCSKCNGHSPEQAKEEFFALIESNQHEVLSEYKGSNKKILIDFKCNHESHWTYPITYKKGHGCPECHFELTSKKQSEQNRKEFPLLVESRGHTLLSPYGKNGKEKVLIDFKCGHEPQLVIPFDYKYNGSGCLKCARKEMAKRARLKSEESAKEFVLLVESNGHVLLTPYGKNQDEKVLIDFQCSHEPHLVAPSNYKLRKGCPECGRIGSNKAKLQNGERLLKKAIKKNNHILLSEYVDVKTKVLIDFKCKHKPHWVTPDSYRHQDSGCPKCKKSKGVQVICQWLEENRILYEIEYLLSNKLWRYDIYLPIENLIIEVHGSQHYINGFYNKKTKKFVGRTLEQEQENDRKKRQYAEKLGYKYIEVDYREHRPELALERFLKAFSEIGRSEKQEHEQLALF
jgi:hypothetical protein